MSNSKPIVSDLVDLYAARHEFRRKLALAAEIEKKGREEVDTLLQRQATDTRLIGRSAYERACDKWQTENGVQIPPEFRLELMQS